MVWLTRGFSLEDPRRSYPGFYLSPQQSYVLSVVKEAGSINPGEVARRLGLEKSHLTKIVNSLIELGAIKKKTDTEDRRRQLLTLTSKGSTIFRELDKASIESYSRFMEVIPEDERESVIHATEVMLKALYSIKKK